jgi:hypothetical protein
MEKLGKFTLGLITFLASLFLEAFVLSQLWNWFITPFGLPIINLWLAIGLSLTIKMFVGFKDSQKKYEKYSEYIIHFMGTAFLSLFVWGFGALITLFI